MSNRTNRVNRFEAQLTTLRSQMLMGALGSITLGCTGVIVFWHESIASSLYSWFFILFLSSLVNYLYTFKTKKLTGLQAYKALNVFTFLGLISGLIWAIPAFWLSGGQPELLQPGFGSFFIIVAIMGMATSAMGSTSAYLPFYYCSVSPFAIALILACFYAEEQSIPLQKMTFVLSLFFVSIYFFTFYINRGLVTAIDLKVFNAELAKNYLLEKDKAEDANRKKSRFLAAASHDLRQPLQSLIFYTDVLSDEINSNKGQDLLQNTKSSISSLNTLLSALLDMSQLDTGEVSVLPTNFSVKSMLEQLNVTYQGIAKKHNIQLKFIANDILIKTDYGLLFRCLSNLIDNAIKHANATRLVIVVRKQGSNVKFYVFDNGKGVSFEEADRIFDEFEQLDNPERDRNKGLGLGLTIVKSTLSLLGHNMQFTSKVDKGSCFTFNVPMGEIIKEDKTRLSLNNFALKGKVIWLIDDEKDIRLALNMLLEKWQAVVVNVTDKANMEAKFNNSLTPMPDIIISDYRLPNGVNGYQLVDAIRVNYNLDIPAVIISGDLEVEQRDLPIVYKPVTGAKLRLILQNSLDL